MVGRLAVTLWPRYLMDVGRLANKRLDPKPFLRIRLARGLFVRLSAPFPGGKPYSRGVRLLAQNVQRHPWEFR